MKYVFFILAFVFFLSSPCLASIGIDKHYIVFDANSKNRNQQITFSNTSLEKKSYRIKLVTYRQLKDGKYEEISEPKGEDSSATPFLLISPNKTTLEAGKTQIVRIQRKPMINAPDGEYVSRLLISEMPPSVAEKKDNNKDIMKIDVKALYAVTIPIIIQKGNLSAFGTVERPMLKTIENKPYLFMSIQRKGTKSLFVNVLVKNSAGDVVGLLNKVRVYLSTNEREIDIPLDKKTKNEKLKIELIDVETDKKIFSRIIP